jgi:hypothetical protein
MRVIVRTMIDAPAEEVWARLRTSALLRHVAAPLLRFKPLSPPTLPEVWTEGDYVVGMYAFGVLPLGKQRIGIRILADHGWPRRIRDDGGGRLVPVWRHDIQVSPAAPDRTLYCDEVEIRAGLLTPGVWLFAQLFYRWRQHRWRRLARTGFATLEGAMP